MCRIHDLNEHASTSLPTNTNAPIWSMSIENTSKILTRWAASVGFLPILMHILAVVYIINPLALMDKMIFKNGQIPPNCGTRLCLSVIRASVILCVPVAALQYM